MRSRPSIKMLAAFLIGLTWTLAAYAATQTLEPPASLSDIPLKAMATAIVLALVGGSARTAQKLAKEDLPRPQVPLLIVADTLTSITVGLATYFFVAWQGFAPLAQALFISVAGWGGSTVLESYAGALIKKIGAAK